MNMLFARGSFLFRNGTPLVLSIVMCALSASAQIPSYTPPSPTSSSLGEYGEIPVGHYTGVPDISIPLYTVRSGEIVLPITLSYHASGIRVSEEASWVGLGWSLNAGGVITRQVAGVDDVNETNGYVRASALPPYDPGSYLPLVSKWGTMLFYSEEDADVQSKLHDYHAGVEDAKPDRFYYNFMGQSGRLVFTKGSWHPVAANQNNMIFSYDESNESWEVTDGNGWKYFFSTPEITRSLAQVVDHFNQRPSGTWGDDITTAWYLDRILTPTGDEINFIYGRTGRFVESQISNDEQCIVMTDLRVNGHHGFALTSLTDFGHDITTSLIQTDEVFLEKIEFSNGYLQFSTTSRLDRVTQDYSLMHAPPALDNIVVYDYEGNEIKTIFLNYGYFREDKLGQPDQANFLRLRLDSIEEWFRKSDGTYEKKPPYSFQYNQIQ